MTGEIRNPVNFLSLLPLLPAEKIFARCLAAEEPCIIGDGELPKKGIESGEDANVIRGEVIRFFAYGGNEENPVLGQGIYLQGAWISGELPLTHASIPYALMFIKCHFVASVMMPYAECIALSLNGSRLAQGLLADGLMTKSSVNLKSGFFAEDEVRLQGANIGGDLDCGGGKFHNPDGKAFSADKSTTKGDVILSGKFFAEGEVRLLGANIGGDLDCTGGKFNSVDGNALSADGLTTKGNVILSGGFSAKGEVRLLNANIGSDLPCVGGKFHNPNGSALSVAGSNISGGIFWRQTTCEGIVSLAYARADVLSDDAGSWESCKVVLDGFTYNRFVGPVDFHSCIEWLTKRPDEMEFSPQPYEQAAKVLFRMGHVHDAREILIKKERLQTKYGKTHLQWKIVRKLWDVFSGYGYRLRYTAAWIMFFVYIGAVIFDVADRHSNIVPTHPVVALSEDYKRKIGPNCGLRPTQAVSPEYPAFHAIMFSVDVFMPSAPFHQEDSWGPRSGGGDWRVFDFDILGLLTFWYWLEIGAGWLLSSLILLSGTGFLRLRQSSSEKD